MNTTHNIDYDNIIKILTAMKEGKQIQVEQYENVWRDLTDEDFPNFKYVRYYRIKPEVKKYRVGLMDFDIEDRLLIVARSESDATELESDPDFVKWLTDWTEYEV